jgi:hypothetical protein
MEEGDEYFPRQTGPYALAIGCARPNPDGCSAALEVEDFLRRRSSCFLSSGVKAAPKSSEMGKVQRRAGEGRRSKIIAMRQNGVASGR